MRLWWLMGGGGCNGLWWVNGDKDVLYRFLGGWVLDGKGWKYPRLVWDIGLFGSGVNRSLNYVVVLCFVKCVCVCVLPLCFKR